MKSLIISLTVVFSLFAGQVNATKSNAFLETINNKLEETKNPIRDIQDSLKIKDAQQICLSLYQGYSKKQIDNVFISIVINIPEKYRDNMLRYYAYIYVYGINYYCPEFNYD